MVNSTASVAAPPTWFTASEDHPVRHGNSAKAFLDGDGYYADLAASIRAAAGVDSVVAFASWDLRTDFALVPGDDSSTLVRLLTDASARGVTIRALLNRHQANPFTSGTITGYDNTDAAAFIDSLPTGVALHDDRYLVAGTHHQKIAVVSTPSGLVAYSGGMDLNPDRLTTGATRCKHDVQVRLTGPVAVDHYEVLAARWADHPGSEPFPGLPPAHETDAAGPLAAQLVTTYGNGTARAGIAPAGYDFAPTGDQSLGDLVLGAIEQARSFIYLEDQYLVNPAVSAALIAALPRLERLVILIADTPAISKELIQAWRRRRAFVLPLIKAAPGKVSVCVGTRLFVHSKLWIFDDELAVIGSANANRRGYTHDSEQAVGIVDTERGAWVQDLRVALWAKHLGLPPELLRDPLTAAAHWFAIPAQADVDPYDPSAGADRPAFPRGTDYFWHTLIDPDGS